MILYDNQRHLVVSPFNLADLHQAAASLGIKRCWFHGGKFPHYDIPKYLIPTVRQQATLVRPREILQAIRDAGF